ncbi:MAG: alpha-galactosidase [Ignavibacteriae bacterium]|nr:alpha-galactosidase [Ignavibacteriota bacterium]
MLAIEPLRALEEAGGSFSFWEKTSDIKLLTDSWERCYGDAGIRSLSVDAPVRSAWDVHLFDTRNRTNCNLSYFQIPSGKLSFHLKRQSNGEAADLTVRSDTHAGTHGVALGPNETFSAGEIMIRFTDGSVFDALESYAELIATRNNIPRPALLPVGWVDWYFAKGLTTEKDILENLDFLARELKDFGLEYVQLDSGWQLGIETSPPPHNVIAGGPWIPNSKFPHGMQWYAEQIKERGLKPGIWVRPFQMVDGATERREHPGWFNKKGQMDFSNPEVLERVRTLFRQLVNDWGYEYIKYDFPSYDLFDAWGPSLFESHWAHADPQTQTITGIQVYRNALEAIRTSAPNTPLLACNSVMPSTLGLANVFRIGDDVGDWNRTFTYGVRSVGARYYTNGVYWTNDPDCLLVREPFTIDQARMWASLVVLSGGVVFISERLHELPPERLDIIKKAMPVYRNPGKGYAFGRPMDLLENDPPEVWNLEVRKRFGKWNVVGLFNWSDQPRIKVLDLKSLGSESKTPFAVYDFWEERYLGIVENSVEVNLKKLSCALLAIHPTTNHPQFLSSNRHITQGGIDLDDIWWDDGAAKLSGVSKVVKGYHHLITIRVPESFVPSMYEGCEKAPSADGRILLLRIYSEATGVMKWSVKFMSGH